MKLKIKQNPMNKKIIILVLSLILAPTLNVQAAEQKQVLKDITKTVNGQEKNIYTNNLTLNSSLGTVEQRLREIRSNKVNNSNQEVKVFKRNQTLKVDGEVEQKIANKRTSFMKDENTKIVKVIKSDLKKGTRYKTTTTHFLNNSNPKADKVIKITKEKADGRTEKITKKYLGDILTIRKEIYENGFLNRIVKRENRVTIVDGKKTTEQLSYKLEDLNLAGVQTRNKICTSKQMDEDCNLKTSTVDLRAKREAAHNARMNKIKLNQENSRAIEGGFKKVIKTTF
jgi:hypothetical protein